MKRGQKDIVQNPKGSTNRDSFFIFPLKEQIKT